MPLKYSLYPNPVKKGEPTYRALVKKRSTFDMDAILDKMENYKTSISRADAAGALELFFSTIENVLLDGGVVSLPLFKAQCSISGNFRNSADRFNHKRHKVNVTMKPGKRIKEMTSFVKPEKTEVNLPLPQVKSFADMASGILNKTITPGSPAIIRGKHLKFDPSDPGQGIFFIPENKPGIKAEIIHVNSFSQLVFIIPNLEPGAYRVCVANNSLSNDVRTGELDARLLIG